MEKIIASGTPSISQGSSLIQGDIPINIAPLIHLYNTWVFAFFPRYFGCEWYRYQGMRGEDMVRDTKTVGEALLSCCKDEGSITIKMLTLVQGISFIGRRGERSYEKPCMYRDKDWNGHGEGIESSFFRILETLGCESRQKLHHNANGGIYLS